jgi:hypothetical protein
MLPEVITHGGGGGIQEDSEFTVSTMIPEQAAFEHTPLRTAAELGFDDSRYDIPDDARELDPVGRSLMREERRAALEAQQQDEPVQDQQQPPQERPLFRDDFQPQQPQQDRPPFAEQNTYDTRQAPYDNRRQLAYDDPQQGVYDEHRGGYDGRQQGGFENRQQNGFDGFVPVQPTHGTGQPDGFTSGYAPQDGYAEALQEPYNPFESSSQRADWQAQDAFREPYRPDFQGPFGPEAESAPDTAAADRERVGFDGHGATPSADSAGPAPSAPHALTDAGLPRRGGGAPQEPAPTPQQAPETRSEDDSNWRSANDARWVRAEQLKKPKAGGVTASGLPRRVPKANLVEGTAESTPQGGPQVSRAPEDVRGRLSNLRRGVQRGRSEGSSDTNGQGFGPDSTYNQER